MTAVLPQGTLTKMMVQQDIGAALNVVLKSLEHLKSEMRTFAAQLTAYPIVMDMRGLSDLWAATYGGGWGCDPVYTQKFYTAKSSYEAASERYDLNSSYFSDIVRG